MRDLCVGAQETQAGASTVSSSYRAAADAGTPLTVPRRTFSKPTFRKWYAQTYGEGFTWPELVALELLRKEQQE